MAWSAVSRIPSLEIITPVAIEVRRPAPSPDRMMTVAAFVRSKIVFVSGVETACWAATGNVSRANSRTRIPFIAATIASVSVPFIDYWLFGSIRVFRVHSRPKDLSLAALFMPQCNHRIGLHGAAGWNVTCHKSHADQHKGNGHKRYRIAGLNSVEQTRKA